jgi:hypothetical protein
VAACPASLLNRALDLLDVHDLVLSTYERIDSHQTSNSSNNAVTNNASSSSNIISSSSGESAIATTNNNVLDLFDIGVFQHDGLLLPEDSILPPLLQHCLQESNRRTQTLSNNNSNNVNIVTADVENLVKVLQRYENHNLALRVLYRTWTNDMNKSQVRNIMKLTIIYNL